MGDQPDDRMIDDCGQSWHRASADLFKTWLPPREDQDREGDHQREDGTDHYEGERQRQVVAAMQSRAVV